jgi:hypothetical protein
MEMRVLIACEESQVVCKAFRALGHEAYSADLQDCSGGHPEWHIQGDVLDVLDDGFDMMIAHPECRYLCLSGARWFEDERYPDRYENFEKGIEFFLKLWHAPIPKICIENSQPLGRTIQRVGRYTQVVQPWQMGEPFTKGAFLWLSGLPNLIYTHTTGDYDFISADCHNEAPGPDRSKIRAQTYQGIGRQMALQWGDGVEPAYKTGLFAAPAA